VAAALAAVLATGTPRTGTPSTGGESGTAAESDRSRGLGPRGEAAAETAPGAERARRSGECAGAALSPPSTTGCVASPVRLRLLLRLRRLLLLRLLLLPHRSSTGATSSPSAWAQSDTVSASSHSRSAAACVRRCNRGLRRRTMQNMRPPKVARQNAKTAPRAIPLASSARQWRAAAAAAAAAVAGVAVDVAAAATAAAAAAQAGVAAAAVSP